MNYKSILFVSLFLLLNTFHSYSFELTQDSKQKAYTEITKYNPNKYKHGSFRLGVGYYYSSGVADFSIFSNTSKKKKFYLGFNSKVSNHFISAGFAPIIYFSDSQSIFMELGISAVITLAELEIKTEDYQRIPVYTDKGLFLGNNISFGIRNERVVFLLGLGSLFLSKDDYKEIGIALDFRLGVFL